MSKKGWRERREYYRQWKKNRESEDRGEFDHLIHSEEISEWIGRDWLVSELTNLANDRQEVQRILKNADDR